VFGILHVATYFVKQKVLFSCRNLQAGTRKKHAQKPFRTGSKYKAFLLALMEKEAKLKGKDKIASDLKAFSKAENLPGVIFNN